MPDLAPFKAIPTRDQASVILARGTWRHRIAAADLPGWIRLYRGLRDRENGKHYAVYLQPVEALEATAKAIGITVPKTQNPKTGPKK